MISAHARMAPWRPWRSIPTAMGSSCGRTGTNKEERPYLVMNNNYKFQFVTKRHPSLAIYFLHSRGNRYGDIVYLLLPYNQVLEASGCGVL